MRKLALTLAIAVALSGCSSYSKAVTAYNVIAAIVGVAQADLPALQAAGVISPAEAPVVGGYVALVGSLNAQYKSCIDNAQSTKLKNASKFLLCASAFDVGLSDPKELAQLRVLNPKAASRVQLWATAVQIGLNSAIGAL